MTGCVIQGPDHSLADWKFASGHQQYENKHNLIQQAAHITRRHKFTWMAYLWYSTLPSNQAL